MKKLTLLTAVILLSLIGCKGPQGDKGDTGIQGARGPGRMEVITGATTSDDFVVTDTRIGQATQVTVYLGDSVSLSESPYFIPGAGVNTYWIGKVGMASIEIINAQLAGATRYVIVMILP